VVFLLCAVPPVLISPAGLNLASHIRNCSEKRVIAHVGMERGEGYGR
jgi:hypothetical protein